MRGENDHWGPNLFFYSGYFDFEVPELLLYTCSDLLLWTEACEDKNGRNHDTLAKTMSSLKTFKALNDASLQYRTQNSDKTEIQNWVHNPE